MQQTKKAAIELSISTIVVIVIAMSMLILGLVLVRTIFTGATYNVQELNKNVEAEINKLFNEQNDKTIVYLPNHDAEVKKGKGYGIAFGVKNTAQGEARAGSFHIDVKASTISRDCPLSISDANSYINLVAGGVDFNLLPGVDPHYNLIKMQVPDTAPLCSVSYDITVTKDSQPYANDFFTLTITA